MFSFFFNSHRYEKNTNTGFTLIELMVSVSIFTVVMLVATSTVFSIVESNKKSHSLKSVMTNLNFALESMMRDIRVGSQYSCAGGGDCISSPGSAFSFKANRDVGDCGGYDPADSNDRIEYLLQGNQIQRIVNDACISPYGSFDDLITSEEIKIESMWFYVMGSDINDSTQPKVVISISGYAGTGQTRSDFSIQTTVSQRMRDQ